MCWLRCRDHMALVLAVSYSGALGGAERVLLDFAAALEAHDVWLACPQGELCGAARVAGLRLAPLRGRPLEVRGSAGDRLLAAARLGGVRREPRRSQQAVAGRTAHLQRPGA